jgi:hypothetical protein
MILSDYQKSVLVAALMGHVVLRRGIWMMGNVIVEGVIDQLRGQRLIEHNGHFTMGPTPFTPGSRYHEIE